MQKNTSLASQIASAFAVEGSVVGCTPVGSGHINVTYKVVFESGGVRTPYILQQIHTGAFKNPIGLMKNVRLVTEHIRRKNTAMGRDPQRSGLVVIPTRTGEDLYFDHASGCWRMYNYITGASSFDEIDSAERFRRAGGAFGEFAMLLSDLPGEILSETIPDFHNTAKRYEAFLSAVEEDRFSRAASALSEIEFLKNRCSEMPILVNLAGSGELPVRVTHNDTKLNNVLFDDVTGETVCVVDLDTVMPGLSLYDFGDSIRYGANTAAED
nr:aminoglycoside phosphotransferase family protein [Clostridia bacterium]